MKPRTKEIRQTRIRFVFVSKVPWDVANCGGSVMELIEGKPWPTFFYMMGSYFTYSGSILLFFVSKALNRSSLGSFGWI